MKEYSTKQASGVEKIETLGGDYALKWDDETQMSVNAHAALLSQFAKAGGFFDRLVETCPMRLTSNNAPDVRDLIATVMVSMVNGATRFRHFDRLHGDTATAELFGVRRFMSCDSVRRNFASIPDGQALPWAWRENLRLLQDVVAEDYVADLDPTVKPLYGHQEGAEFGYNPQKPGRPSHCYHTLCIAKLRLTLAVVVHPGNETSGTHSRSMLAEYLEFVSAVKKPRLVRGDVSANGRKVWECYVLGLDPEVATNDFRIVSFPMKADGTPDLANIRFDPPQARWNVPATYKVMGAESLKGPWGEVPAGGNPAYRFFKVEVVLP